MNNIHNLQTARNWHDNHYEHTTPDSHQGRWRRFIEIDPFNPCPPKVRSARNQQGQHPVSLNLTRFPATP